MSDPVGRLCECERKAATVEYPDEYRAEADRLAEGLRRFIAESVDLADVLRDHMIEMDPNSHLDAIEALEKWDRALAALEGGHE